MIDERNLIAITDASTINLISGPSQVNLIDIVSGGFVDPTSIAGLQGWWQADDIAGSDGDPVATWSDLSGNARDFTTTGGFQPTLQTAEVNGHKALRFDGLDDFMEIASQNLASGWGITSSFTAFFAIKTNSGAGQLRPLYYWTSSGTNEFGCWYEYSDNNAYVDCGNVASGGRASGAVAANTTWMVVVIIRNAGTVDVYEDGANVLHVTGLTDGLDSGTASLTIPSIATNYNWCDIEELGFYNTAISGGDQTSLEAYLSARVL